MTFVVFDNTTHNVLGEFDTLAAAVAFKEEIRPYGRYGPTGHDLQVDEWPNHASQSREADVRSEQ